MSTNLEVKCDINLTQNTVMVKTCKKCLLPPLSGNYGFCGEHRLKKKTSPVAPPSETVIPNPLSSPSQSVEVCSTRDRLNGCREVYNDDPFRTPSQSAYMEAYTCLVGDGFPPNGGKYKTHSNKWK